MRFSCRIGSLAVVSDDLTVPSDISLTALDWLPGEYAGVLMEPEKCSQNQIGRVVLCVVFALGMGDLLRDCPAFGPWFSFPDRWNSRKGK